MVKVGMRYPVCATFSAHTEGSEPTYASTGIVMGHAISGNLSITRNANPLYGDDREVESDNGITAMSLELGLDGMELTAKKYVLGLTEVQTTGQTPTTDYYVETDASAPYVGVGYIQVLRHNGADKYIGVWYYKVIFGEDAENLQTKGESIDWQTQTLTGRCLGLAVDSSGKIAYRKIKEFTSESAAKTWLNGLAGIS